MGMNMRLYLLIDTNGNDTKIWYPLSLNMKKKIHFFYIDNISII